MRESRNRVTDMTEGDGFRQLLHFTLPLIFGNVFQLTYGMVDAIVVGRYAGKEALAAVGAGDPIINLLILGISGVCVGASVLMSSFFGAGQEGLLKEQMKATLFIGGLLALAVMPAGLAGAEWLLGLLRTPEEIMKEAAGYLRILFLGMPFTCVYNIYAAALRSVGNTGAPTRYLILSSLLNMALDILLVAGWGMGAAGAGIATVCAEGVSALLCVLYVRRRVPLLRCGRTRLRINGELVRKTLSYGGLTALQQCSQPIGNLCIQGAVNALGATSMAAFHAVRRIEDIGLVPGRNISGAITTFTAQNVGAGKRERTERGFRQGIGLELVGGGLVCLLLWWLGEPFMSLFTKDGGIVEAGESYFAVMALAYWLPGLTNGHQGYFRGIGAMKTVLAGTVSQITVRVLVTLWLTPVTGIRGVGLACIAGWLVQLSWQAPYRLLRARRLAGSGERGR